MLGISTDTIDIRILSDYILRQFHELGILKMKASDLPAVWGKPDTSVLTPKQMSIRLPVVVAAKIDALLDMYPHKSRTEIIGDLLATALDDFAKGLEYHGVGHADEHPDYPGEVFYEHYMGSGPDFEHAWQRQLKKYEDQLGHEIPIRPVRREEDDSA